MQFDNKRSLERVLALRGVKSLTEAVQAVRKEKKQPKNGTPLETPRVKEKSEVVNKPSTPRINPWNDDFALVIKLRAEGMSFEREGLDGTEGLETT